MYPMSPPSKHFFTLLYGVLDTRANRFRYVAAGHPGPTLVRADGAVELNDATAIPLGVLEDVEFEEACITLEPGDRLFVYSDGAYESRDPAGNMIGRDVFNEWLGVRSSAVEESIDAIEHQLLAWTEGRELRDDVTLLGFEHCR
jgi:sigma-B regulation protein RsbU (phosphoserine phosphatase)